MADNHDAILLESVKTHRARLRAAFLFGQLDERRTANDNVKRLVGSLVLAAVACAACVGVSFVVKTLADQEEIREAQQQNVPVATYDPDEIPTPPPTSPKPIPTGSP